MAETMREGVKSALDTTADKAKQAADWAVHKGDQLTNGVKEGAHMVAEKATQVKDTVVDAVSSGSHSVQSVGNDVADLVRKYPIAAVAVGLGLGILLGSRSSRHS